MDPFEAELARRQQTASVDPFEAELARRQSAAPPPPLGEGTPTPTPPRIDAPVKAAEPTTLDRVKDAASGVVGVLDRGVRGVARGVVGLPGILPDIASGASSGAQWLIERASGEKLADQPEWVQSIYGWPHKVASVAGTEALRRTLLDAPENAIHRAVGAEPPKPVGETFPQRMAERVGEEIGAALVPAGLAAKVGARLGPAAAREMQAGGLSSMYDVGQAALNPGAYIGKNVRMATAAGTGAAAVNEINPADKNSWQHAAGDLVGALGGGGLAAVAGAVGPKVVELFNAFRASPKYVDKTVKGVVTNNLAEAFGEPQARVGGSGMYDTADIVKQIEEGRRVGATVPGFQESLADRTRNPNVAAMEYSRQSAENSGAYAARRSANTTAIDNAMDQSAPNGQPGALRQNLELERDRQLGDAAVHTANAQDTFDAAARKLQTTMNAEGRGADIRGALEDAKAAAREVEREAWGKVPQSAPADITPLAQKFDAITGGLSEAERARFAPSEATIPTTLLERGAVQPVSEVTGMRSALTSQIRAANSAGDVDAARVLGKYVDAIDQHLATATPPEAQAAFEQARAVSRNLNDRFTRPQTAIAQTLDRNQGMYSAPDSAVPRKFVQPNEGRVADFDALMKEAGTDARAQNAVKDQILQDVKDRGLADNPEAMRDYVARHGKVLDAFPDLKRQIEETAGARGQLAERQTAEASLQKSIDAGAVGRYLKYGDENSEKAMRSVLASPDPKKAIDELMNFAGNSRDSIEGARQIFWGMMQKSGRRAGETTSDISGRQPWMPGKLQAFLDDPRNAAVAERLYKDDPEHLANIRKVSEAIQGIDIRNAAKAGNTSGTAQGVNPLLTPETLQSRVYAYKRGQVSGTFLVTSIAAVAARRATATAQKTAIGKMMDEALLNPDFAAQLLKENNPVNRAAMARQAKGWLGHEAGTFVDMLNHEDDPVKEAVTRK